MSRVNSKDREQRQKRYSNLIVNYDYISHALLVFLLLTLKKLMLVGKTRLLI